MSSTTASPTTAPSATAPSATAPSATAPSATASPVGRLTMIVAAALCVAVAAVHIDDQGGITAFAAPDWFGWAYRLIELGSIVVAGALVFAAGAAIDDVRAKLMWVAAALVGAGPFVGYVLTRSTGLPGDSADIGNWGDVLGIVSLIVEGLLVVLAVAGLLVRSTADTAPIATTAPATSVPREHDRVLAV